MAENRSEITFAEIRDAMQLNEDEVEEFLIEVIKTRLVRAKISQVKSVDSVHFVPYPAFLINRTIYMISFVILTIFLKDEIF